MHKKSKTLFSIFSVLLLLSGAYYGSIVWKNKKAEPVSSFTPALKLGSIESSSLVKIEVPGFALEKINDSWELIYHDGKIPPGFELDQRQIQILAYTLTSIWIDRIVDETPSGLSVYGLDKPGARVILTDSAGEMAEFILGDITPSRTAYYAMTSGDPAVYTISSYQAESMSLTLDSIRQRSLFSAFAPGEIRRVRIESAQKRIEISVKPEAVPPYLASAFSTYLLTSPYLLPRGVYAEVLHDFLKPFNNLEIIDFIDDDPGFLRAYGLDRPIRFFIEAKNKSLDLLLGNEVDGKRYAKLAAAHGIFTVGGLEPVINAKPFALIDKFLFLINIDMVERLSISGGERTLSADFEGIGDESTFYLDGKKAESFSFRTFYQTVVGLFAEAEYPAQHPAEYAGASGTVLQSEDAGINIDFRLNTPPDGRVSINLVPYNRDFYAVKQDGTMEFLVSRSQVRGVFDAANKVVFE